MNLVLVAICNRLAINAAIEFQEVINCHASVLSYSVLMKGRLGRFLVREPEAVDLFARGLRQIRYQPQGNCEFIQLEVGTKEGNGAQCPWLPGNFDDLDTSFAQRLF